MKKPTEKQLAARAKFAEMARSGALAKKREAAPRKKNPVKSTNARYVVYRGNIGHVFAVDLTRLSAVKIAKHQHETTGDRFFVEHGDTGAIVYDSKYAPVRDVAVERRARRKNPLTRVKVKSPSMATKKAPSKRLTARRKATAKAPAGYYANPVKHAAHVDARYVVQTLSKDGKYWNDQARFVFLPAAEEYAKALHKANGIGVRVDTLYKSSFKS